MDHASSDSLSMNDSGTCEKIDTPLTQLRSPGVHGWTYFIRVDDAIKIGFASKPKKRIAGMQTSHQKEIETLAIIPASLIDEYKTHQLFAHLRIRGEWFRAEPDLLSFIEQAKVEAEAIPEPARPQPTAKAPPAPPSPALAIQAMVRRLIVARSIYGANTPEGHACSNLAEMLPNMVDYVRPAWASHECQTLPWMIKQQMKRLEAAKAMAN